MHCHIGWHVGEGLSLQFLELPDQIPGLFSETVNGEQFQQTCNNWKTYEANDPEFNKTDSGLRRRSDLEKYASGHMNVRKHFQHGHSHVRHAVHKRSLYDY